VAPAGSIAENDTGRPEDRFGSAGAPSAAASAVIPDTEIAAADGYVEHEPGLEHSTRGFPPRQDAQLKGTMAYRASWTLIAVV